MHESADRSAANASADWTLFTDWCTGPGHTPLPAHRAPTSGSGSSSVNLGGCDRGSWWLQVLRSGFSRAAGYGRVGAAGAVRAFKGAGPPRGGVQGELVNVAARLGHQDQFPEQVVLRPSEQLHLPGFDLVDGALDGSGVVPLGQTGGDSLDVTSQADGERS